MTGSTPHEPPAVTPGPVLDEHGARFSVYAQNAETVELCLFGPDGTGVEKRAALEPSGGGFWTVRVDGVGTGERYGFRVSGSWAPKQGRYFNPHKLLLDPYARAVAGTVQWHEAVYAYRPGEPDQMDERDNAALVPKSVLVDEHYEWDDRQRPRVALQDTVIYELHVKGFTRRHPDVPEADRGTFRGLTAPAVIEYLKSLGVTTLELLPCATCVTPQWLQEKNLTNYWGYDPVAFFAPDARLAAGEPVAEFKHMVDTLHREGFEVILDVVFNHTGEGDRLGPSVSLRGLDNAVYYRLAPDDPGRYVDYTGCGNTLNMEHPATVRLVIDALRYWVEAMHVDGFRFDLATSVGRQKGTFKKQSTFFQIIAADPVLSRVKLIAEPWDLGPGGYQLGHYPHGWSEWNDRYRDAMRRYWRGDESMLAEFARRLSGSADVFAHSDRPATASVNLITAHDGFTLRDLVSYETRHNEANGEHGRDGHHENYSANYGAEGSTDDPDILALRARQQRNLLAALMLSHGVPMLLAGDEIDHTQGGNNNVYCQDNETAWLDWELDERARSLLEFTRLLIGLRARYGVFRQDTYLHGRLMPGFGYRDVEWLRPDGPAMSRDDWTQPFARYLGVLLTGGQAGGAHCLLLANAGDRPIEATLPGAPGNGRWRCEFDTAEWPDRPGGDRCGGDVYALRARSTVLLSEAPAENGRGE